MPGDDLLLEFWEAEHRRAVLQRGISRLRAETRTDERTIRAFEMLAFEELGPQEVARRAGMNENEVYPAKHRCLKRLRQIVEELNAACELTWAAYSRRRPVQRGTAGC